MIKNFNDYLTEKKDIGIDSNISGKDIESFLFKLLSYIKAADFKKIFGKYNKIDYILDVASEELHKTNKSDDLKDYKFIFQIIENAFRLMKESIN